MATLTVYEVHGEKNRQILAPSLMPTASTAIDEALRYAKHLLRSQGYLVRSVNATTSGDVVAYVYPPGTQQL